MNEIQILIKQDFKNLKPITPSILSKKYYTTDEMSKFVLHIFASYCVSQYSSLKKTFRSKFFYTSIPILIETYYNGEYCFTFTQFRYQRGLIYNSEKEALIRIKDGIYVLKDINDKNVYVNNQSDFNCAVSVINFDKVFNTIEYQNREVKKIAPLYCILE